MSAQAAAVRCSIPNPRERAGRWRDRGLSLVGGVGFTALLFAGIAWYERSTIQPPAPELNDLTLATLPVTPPPPPAESAPAEADPTPMAGFEPAPSPSTVKVAVSPPDLQMLRPQDLSRAPTATLALRLPNSFRPKANLQVDARHIYQRYEVDRVPTVIVENAPQVTSRMMDGASVLRVTLIWVIEADGSVTNVRVASPSGKPEVDALIMQMIEESLFTPALKGGRKVRMMTQQQITVKIGGASPFQL